MKKGLIVFAREPLPGEVKTRLAAAVGDQVAADLYESMLQDVLKTARQLTDIETVVFWDCEKESLPVLSEKYSCNSRCQVAGDLGQRMQAAFEEMFADGCELCCIIGSDAPDLPLPYIQESHRLLAAMQIDVVFGPSLDGGYYLLGLRQLRPQLFVDISWSTAAVLEQSLIAAQGVGLKTTLLPEWQDIDTIEDLQAFQERKRRSAAMEPT
ncbi:MAG: TIGR04282 family arsenosugar biosynthesis glycosyltransferase [Desulfuromonadaceae bacterium]